MDDQTSRFMVGFRRFPDLTFNEAFHSNLLVRVVVVAAAVFAGLTLGFATALQ
jgi:ABC-type sugar transport system permease subunit